MKLPWLPARSAAATRVRLLALGILLLGLGWTVAGRAQTAADVVPPTPDHPAFFAGEISLGNGIYYLAFPNGTPFGYYTYLSDPRYIYHFDLGYLAVIDANTAQSGVYFYDFGTSRGSLGYFYSAPNFPFPYIYDFNLNTYLYYFPDRQRGSGFYTTNPRIFARLDNNQILFY